MAGEITNNPRDMHIEAEASDRQLDVLNLMEEQGGSFVSALAKAWKLADAGNRLVLHAAFRHYFELYAHRLDSHRARLARMGNSGTCNPSEKSL